MRRSFQWAALAATLFAVATPGVAAAKKSTKPHTAPSAAPATTAHTKPAPTSAAGQTLLGSGVLPGFADYLQKADVALSAADQKTFAAAFEAIDIHNWPRALSLSASLHTPLAAKLITWAYLVAEETKPGFDELVKFTAENAGWPLQDTMLAKAERALPADMAPKKLIAWFAGQEPLTGEGMIRLGQAQIADGQTAFGQGWIERVWKTQILDAKQQKDLYANYQQILKGAPTAERLISSSEIF